ncbi:uncharacterized protein LOC126324502 [Schistocerca gregaria]|uniref:uncharacterized protein LOC126324502 n=1 Tax=Schistocerca gregaria TaxID=7010 RepID=UPI00211E3C44|nr:uncharacterized protein LOC126324502 [Schistocerca gregaria]
MDSMYKAPIVLEALVKPSKGTVILIHGLGDSGAGWLPTAKQIQRAIPSAKFILPNAPNAPVTMNMGMVMPSWYDILTLEDKAKQDFNGLEKSKAYFLSLIKAEADSGVQSEKIILMGFSQGGACSLYTGYSCPYKLGGIVSLSGYLPIAERFHERLDKTNINTPFLLCHGLVDDLIKTRWSRESSEILKNAGIPGELRFYKNLGHFTSEEEISDVTGWLRNRIES